MNLTKIMLTLVLLCCGCGTYQLDQKWLPLEELVERPGSGSFITTIGNKAYVTDLSDWLDEHPPGSVTFEAILLHEQEHAKRQLEYGLSEWIKRYRTDSLFRWREEQRGYYLQLNHLQDHGYAILFDKLAVVLSEEYGPNMILAGQMVSLEAARDWLYDVWNGFYHPDIGD